MKYNQPYGISDPTAPYINGNPSTGTMGSIPPAASIEYPQREIANLITDSGITPDNADLRQLGRSVQNGHVTYALDTGSVNNVVLTLSPPLLSYHAGMFIRFKAKYTPQGPSVININGLGNKRMRGRNNLDIRAADFLANDIVLAVYDGTDFQVLGTDAQPRLQAPRTYYVATDGSDNSDGLTAQTAFLTLQKALNQVPLFNLNGFGITIYIANGTYISATSNVCQTINGTGAVSVIGNPTTPGNVIIRSNSGTAIQVYGEHYSFDGLRLECLGPAVADPGKGFSTVSNYTYLQNIVFGNCNDGCINVGGNASLLMSGSFWVLTAQTPTFLQGYLGGAGTTNELTWPALTITAGMNFSRAFAVSTSSLLAMRFSSISGTASGIRYQAGMNGTISSGAAGPNYFPGDQAGQLSTGGQYL